MRAYFSGLLGAFLFLFCSAFGQELSNKKVNKLLVLTHIRKGTVDYIPEGEVVTVGIYNDSRVVRGKLSILSRNNIAVDSEEISINTISSIRLKRNSYRKSEDNGRQIVGTLFTIAGGVLIVGGAIVLQDDHPLAITSGVSFISIGAPVLIAGIRMFSKSGGKGKRKYMISWEISIREVKVNAY